MLPDGLDIFIEAVDLYIFNAWTAYTTEKTKLANVIINTGNKLFRRRSIFSFSDRGCASIIVLSNLLKLLSYFFAIVIIKIVKEIKVDTIETVMLI